MTFGNLDHELSLGFPEGVSPATPLPFGQAVRPAWVVAVLPNGFPDRSQFTPASCLAMQPASMTLGVAATPALPAGRWVVGVATSPQQWAFASVEVSQPIGATRTLVEAAFLRDERDFFHVRQRIPHCHPQTQRFQTTLSAAALGRWVDLGVLQPQFYDRVMLCPKCEGVPSIRGGCQVCGSGHVSNTTNIHHFNCGYVGRASEFEQTDRLECPRCHAQNLVVGADYEYQTDSHICEDCGWQDANLEFVLQCLACHLRFPIHQAVEHELIAHHVNRLDPLAAFPAT